MTDTETASVVLALEITVVTTAVTTAVTTIRETDKVGTTNPAPTVTNVAIEYTLQITVRFLINLRILATNLPLLMSRQMLSLIIKSIRLTLIPLSCL